MIARIVLTLGLVLCMNWMVWAERPPQKRETASLVVVGVVEKVEEKESAFGGDGVRTDYTATVKVEKVDSGTDAKAGDTVKVTWFRVTKSPSNPFPGAYGQAHGLKSKDRAKFWLNPSKKKDTFEIIYNTDGVEKIKE